MQRQQGSYAPENILVATGKTNDKGFAVELSPSGPSHLRACVPVSVCVRASVTMHSCKVLYLSIKEYRAEDAFQPR